MMEADVDEFMQEGIAEGCQDGPDEAIIFARNFDEAIEQLRRDTPLCNGSSVGADTFAIKLLSLLAHNACSKNMGNSLFELIGQALPAGHNMAKSPEAATRILKSLGLTYKVFDVCKCEQYVYRTNDVIVCPKCGESRYHSYIDNSGEKVTTKKPHRQVRILPLRDRIRAWLRIRAMSKALRYANSTENQQPDGPDRVVRGIKDSRAIQYIKGLYPQFRADGRNTIWALCFDGVCPRTFMETHSSWPAFVCCLNLPEWVFISQFFSPMVMLVGGEADGKAPKHMHVFLELVAEEFMHLWNGFWICDILDEDDGVYHPVRVQGLLALILHDYPAYGKCLGIPDSGKNACLLHGPNWPGVSISVGKIGFLGNDRMLEDRPAGVAPPPPVMSFDEYFKYCRDLRGTPEPFFKLPYWKMLLIRHAVDEFHLCANMLLRVTTSTCGQAVKPATRRFLKAKNLNPELWMQEVQVTTRSKGKTTTTLKQVARHPRGELTTEEKKASIEADKAMAYGSLPDHFSGFPIGILAKGKAVGIKTRNKNLYACKGLPVSLRGKLHPDGRAAFLLLSAAWDGLFSSRALNQQQLHDVGQLMIKAVVAMERIIPAGEMSRSMHVAVHLAEQVTLLGLPETRTMAWGERAMREVTTARMSNLNAEFSMGESFMAKEALRILSYFIHEQTEVKDPHFIWDLLDQDPSKEVKLGAIVRKRVYKFSRQQRAEVNALLMEHALKHATYEAGHGDEDYWRDLSGPRTDGFDLKAYAATEAAPGEPRVPVMIQAALAGVCKRADEHDTVMLYGCNYRTQAADSRCRKHKNAGIAYYEQDGTERYGFITQILNCTLRQPKDGWANQIILRVELFDQDKVKHYPAERLTVIDSMSSPRTPRMVHPTAVSSVGFVGDPAFAPQLAVVHVKLPRHLAESSAGIVSNDVFRSLGSSWQDLPLLDMPPEQEAPAKGAGGPSKGKRRRNQQTSAEPACEPTAGTPSRGKRRCNQQVPVERPLRSGRKPCRGKRRKQAVARVDPDGPSGGAAGGTAGPSRARRSGRKRATVDYAESDGSGDACSDRDACSDLDASSDKQDSD